MAVLTSSLRRIAVQVEDLQLIGKLSFVSGGCWPTQAVRSALSSIERLPRPPDSCCHRLIILYCVRFVGSEPVDKLFVDDSRDIFDRACLDEPRKDGSHLGLIFVGVCLVVDVDRVSIKQNSRNHIKKIAVPLPQRCSLTPDDVAVRFHEDPKDDECL